jgi:hypothetical protein
MHAKTAKALCKYPNHVAVFVSSPSLKLVSTKFMVEKNMSIAHLMWNIRSANKLSLSLDEGLYMSVKNELPIMTATVGQTATERVLELKIHKETVFCKKDI